MADINTLKPFHTHNEYVDLRLYVLELVKNYQLNDNEYKLLLYMVENFKNCSKEMLKDKVMNFES
jgi:DNA-binding winged helix-turn-helix (wHTH) protein